MPIQLSDQQLTIIKKILNDNLDDIQYRFFGSRTKGTAKKYSDLDIVLIGHKIVPLQILSQLDECFAESDLPFKVDLVDWHRITPEFQNKIQSEWIEV